MSDSTQHLATLTANQASKEVTANALFAAMSKGALFGIRTIVALTLHYYGDRIYINGAATNIPDATFRGSIALTDAATNYVEVDRAGVVSKNTTGFSADKAPLWKLVASGGAVTSYEDHRDPMVLARLFFAQAAQAMADANKTLTLAQALCHSVELTGALTALRDVIVPTVRRQWTIFANTTGGFGVRVKTSAGSGITVADGKRAILECDGTNVGRVTPDV